MPIKNLDPFDGFVEKLDPKVNPYVGKLVEHAAKGDLPIGYGEGLRTYVGSWRKKIGSPGPWVRGNQDTGASDKTEVLSSGPLILEVGCHQGHTLVTMAQRYPHCKFIGIDITFKRIVSTGQKIASMGLGNAFCALANAKRVSVLFEARELDGVVVFFPDPWVKKARQAKNRLIDLSFALELKAALTEGGFIWLKTDQKHYADDAQQVLHDVGFRIDSSSAFPALFDQDFSSTFERRFREKNIPTYSVIAYL